MELVIKITIICLGVGILCIGILFIILNSRKKGGKEIEKKFNCPYTSQCDNYKKPICNSKCKLYYGHN